MHTRLTNVLKERTEFLKSSVDKYLIVESKTLKELKENLELELANIKVNNAKYESFNPMQIFFISATIFLFFGCRPLAAAQP